MSELHELVAAMRTLGVVRLRKDDEGNILEVELAPPAEASEPVPPPPGDDADDVGPVFSPTMLATEGKCVRCGKVPAAGLVPGHCRPCGKLTANGN